MGIVQYKNFEAELEHYYKTGGGKTFYLGFNNLAMHYSIKEGGVTDWTGYPGSGKTELLLECLKNCSNWYDHKHLIYMPDAGTNAEVIGKLIHKLSGRQFESFYYNSFGEKVMIEDRISWEDAKKYAKDVLEYFKIFLPEKEGNRSKAVTPVDFWQYAVSQKETLGIFSAVIDSWNYMHHNTEGYSREDKWLEATLSHRNELAESSGMHFHTIIHPKSAVKNKEGKIIIPDMHCLKGGSEWSNNGKSIIVVHREFGSSITDVKIEKAKPKIVGVQGMTCLQYDIKAGAYFEINGDEHNHVVKFAEPLKADLAWNTLTPMKEIERKLGNEETLF